MNMDAIIRPSKIGEESAVDSVVSAIRTALISGQFKPGDKLPSESELVSALGVSRGTLREAMKILQAYGIVKIRQGNGTYFSEDTDDISTKAIIMRYAMLQPSEEDCWEFRSFFEEEILLNAIKFAGEADIDKLKENLRKMNIMRSNCDVTAKLDVEFHLLLGKMTPNKLIRSTYAAAISFLEPTFIRNHGLPNHVEKTIMVHSKTIEAIRCRDNSRETVQTILKINEDSWIRNP